MRKIAGLVAAAAGTLALIAASPANAITGNYSKDFEHDYVGLLVFYTTPDPETGDPFSHRCSGTLISPTVVLTAGHCTEGVDEGRIYFQQSVAPNYDPEAFGGWGGDPTTGYPYQGGLTFHRADNYGFHDFEGYPENRDAGVVVLDAPYTPPSGKFGLLPQAGAVDRYVASFKKKQNALFRTSGYGLSGTTPQPTSFRERLTAIGYLVENQDPVTTYNIKTTANASQGKGGSCNGDSGGPVFFEGTRVIAAVVSFGQNAKCRGLDFSYRIDRAPVLNWINDPNRTDAG
jgi:V8-like Glu-specific endopeptidase